eukprot:3703393-Amphidinium_carterae.1
MPPQQPERCCNFGATTSQVSMRTRGLYNSTSSLLFDSEDEATTYLKFSMLRSLVREFIQHGVPPDSIRLHVPSKSVYLDQKSVLWVRRQRVCFAGVGEQISETVRDSWEFGGQHAAAAYLTPITLTSRIQLAPCFHYGLVADAGLARTPTALH